MDLKLNNPKTFNVTKNDEITYIELPSAGLSLLLDEKAHTLFTNEVSRFLKETIYHSRYVIERFTTQHEYLNSHIDSLIHKKLWSLSGFADTALNSERNLFKYEAEEVLEFMPSVFMLNAKLLEFKNQLPVKSSVTGALPQWPSIEKMNTLPLLQKESFSGKWDVPIRFTSSGRLAGLFKPVIFHDGSLEISLNSGKLKFTIDKEDADKLLALYFSEQEFDEFDIAREGWEGLSRFEDKIRKFINSFYDNGFEKDTQCFSLDSVNIDGIHEAVRTLKTRLESEAI